MTVKTYLHVECPTETRKVAGSTPALATTSVLVYLAKFRTHALRSEMGNSSCERTNKLATLIKDLLRPNLLAREPVIRSRIERQESVTYRSTLASIDPLRP